MAHIFLLYKDPPPKRWHGFATVIPWCVSFSQHERGHTTRGLLKSISNGSIGNSITMIYCYSSVSNTDRTIVVLYYMHEEKGWKRGWWITMATLTTMLPRANVESCPCRAPVEVERHQKVSRKLSCGSSINNVKALCRTFSMWKQPPFLIPSPSRSLSRSPLLLFALTPPIFLAYLFPPPLHVPTLSCLGAPCLRPDLNQLVGMSL